MIISKHIIKDFLNDFGFIQYEGIVCFDAVIQLKSKYRNIQLPTDIYIRINSFNNQTLSCMYLLDPDIEKHSVPSEILIDENDIVYIKNNALFIGGYSTYDDLYTLSIIPVTKQSSELVYLELFQKIYN